MSADPVQPQSYKDAGVDIDAGDQAVRLLAPYAKKTFTPQVLSDIGPFGGLYRLGGYQEPVLVSSVDGVGTKVLLAKMMDRHDTVGADLVNHCINDIFTLGATPLFFLDYIATGKVLPERVAEIVKGMAEACKDVSCALIGGETAEMPGIYAQQDYDIAGFMVGVVERWGLIDGRAIRPGDALIGLPSSGLHTSGYSLARRIFNLDDDPARLSVHEADLGRTLGDALMETHRSYYHDLNIHLAHIRGLAHITGGGISGNLPRILPPNARAIVRRRTWHIPPLFQLIQSAGNVTDEEMFRTFNMGVGMIVVVRAKDARDLMQAVDGSWLLGEVVEREEGQPAVEIE